MSNVPTNLIPTRISQLPEAPVADPAGYFPIVISGTTYKVQFSQIQGNVEVPASRRVDTGTGLTGGGSLSANLTIAVANDGIGEQQLDTTGVAAGTYGSGAAVPVITVTSKGRVTNVSTTPLVITGYVPDGRQIVAGTGLAGGGNLSADRTLSIDYSSTIPSALGSATVGTASTPARADHVHPALDLSDSTETTGVLMMGRGGTGSALAPVAGAVVVSNGTNISLTSAGSPGQILFSNGSSPPSFGSTNSLVVAAANRLNGGAANQVVYQSATDQTSFVVAPTVSGTFLKWNGSSFEWGAVAGAGTVTSIDGSGGTTGLTLSGGPITTAGTLTLGGTLDITAGGTGLGATATNGQLLIGNGSGYTLASLTAGTAISVTNATGSITLANTAPDQTVTLTDGTAIDVTGTYPSFTITNTLPDQTVVISSGTNISVSGTYPSFTVTNTSTADVVGPAGATSGAISLFDGATGKLLKNSVITINGSGVISNVNTPNTGTDAANKQYVDDLASTGLHYHEAVVLSTSPGSSRTDTYNQPGGAGVGVSATLTSVANGTLVIDGTVASATIRVLIQDCSNPVGNGVYVVTNAGSTSTQYVMTRSSDADTYIEQSTVGLDSGSYFFTTGGTSNKGTAWVNTNSGVITFGSTAISFSLFSNSQVYTAGNGLSLTATTFSLDTPVSVLNGGTGNSSAPTNGQLLIGNGSNFSLSALTAGTAISVTNATGSITLANTAPDQTVTLTGGGGTTVSGTYPSFTISTTVSAAGVTSVDVAGGTTGLTFSGGPVTSSGTITMAGTLAITNGGTGTSTATGSGAVVLQSSAVLNSLTISSMLTTSLVVNLNADLLDGQTGSYYLDLANATGTLSGGTY